METNSTSAEAKNAACVPGTSCSSDASWRSQTEERTPVPYGSCERRRRGGGRRRRRSLRRPHRGGGGRLVRGAGGRRGRARGRRLAGAAPGGHAKSRPRPDPPLGRRGAVRGGG